jgi:hypothetical protein
MENERLAAAPALNMTLFFLAFFFNASERRLRGHAPLTPLGRCSGSDLAEILDQAQSVIGYSHGLNAVRPKTRT